MCKVSGKKIYRDKKISQSNYSGSQTHLVLGLNCAYTMASWLRDLLEAPILKWHQKLDKNQIHGHWTRTHDQCMSSGTEAGRQDHLPEGEGKDLGNRQPKAKREALPLCCQGIIHTNASLLALELKLFFWEHNVLNVFVLGPLLWWKEHNERAAQEDVNACRKLDGRRAGNAWSKKSDLDHFKWIEELQQVRSYMHTSYLSQTPQTVSV